jgi:hypothetical protein
MSKRPRQSSWRKKLGLQRQGLFSLIDAALDELTRRLIAVERRLAAAKPRRRRR